MSKMHARIDEITSNMQSLRQKRFNKGNQVEEMENQVRLTRREMSSLQSEIHQDELKLTQQQTYLENALMRLNTDYQMTYENAKSQKKISILNRPKKEFYSYVRKLIN